MEFKRKHNSRNSSSLFPTSRRKLQMVQTQKSDTISSRFIISQNIASSRNEVMDQQLSVAKTLLQQAVDLLDNRLSSDEQLIVRSKYMPGSTIGQFSFIIPSFWITFITGKHLRHAVDHYALLLNCLSNQTSRVLSYDTRVRNTPMETSRVLAKNVLMETIAKLDEVLPTANPDEGMSLNAVTPHMHTFKTSIGREVNKLCDSLFWETQWEFLVRYGLLVCIVSTTGQW